MTGWAGFNAFLEFLRTPYYADSINWDLDPPVGSKEGRKDMEFHGRSGQPLIIFFSGSGLDSHGEAVYNWRASTQSLSNEYSLVYVRDQWQSWYHHGIRGISRSVTGTAHWIEKLVRILKPPYVVLVGQSAGGYAVLLHGLNVELPCRLHVLAICPQTLLMNRVECHSHGNLYRIRETWGTRYLNKEDIVDYSVAPMNDYTFTVYYGDDPVDIFHAERLVRAAEPMVLRKMSGSHSETVAAFRDKGILQIHLAEYNQMLGADNA